jgi:hypothetical protein
MLKLWITFLGFPLQKQLSIGLGVTSLIAFILMLWIVYRKEINKSKKAR